VDKHCSLAVFSAVANDLSVSIIPKAYASKFAARVINAVSTVVDYKNNRGQQVWQSKF
jgi:hypothetical protein